MFTQETSMYMFVIIVVTFSFISGFAAYLSKRHKIIVFVLSLFILSACFFYLSSKYSVNFDNSITTVRIDKPKSDSLSPTLNNSDILKPESDDNPNIVDPQKENEFKNIKNPKIDTNSL